MKEYEILFDPDWDEYFKKLDRSVQIKIAKIINKLEGDIPARHMKHGLPYYVIELGQYRICFKIDKENMIKILYFVGNHRDYEKWYQSQ
jgi:mRNA-degrading endonuclease RelE of RelBE toxin-antitoxin system